MKIYKTFWLAISLVALLLVGCDQQQLGMIDTGAYDTTALDTTETTELLKVGWMGPLSGGAASYGESIKKGVELALKDSGLDVELVVEDSKCDAKDAVSAITKLVTIDQVQVIIGEVCSGATLASAPIANDYKTPMISSASTSPSLTTAGDYIFRVVPSDALQGDFGANLVYDAGHEKLAILYSNEEYGLGFNTVLVDKFQGIGGQAVASEAFERESADLRTQLTKIKAAEPDAVYIISNSPDSSVAALKQLKELEIDAAVYGSEGLKSADLVEAAGSAAEGLTITSVSFGTAEFAANHLAEYGEEAGPFAAQGYDAFMAIAETVKAGATTGEDIRSQLFGVEFDGVSGHVKFDANGDVSGNYEVFQVSNGEFVAIE